MVDAQVRQAYAARAAEYISLFGSIEAAMEQDRQHLVAWAQAVDGRIVDVGCGPGQWTNHLYENGADIEGVDPVPEFVDDAQRRFPNVDFRVGHAEQLGVEDGSLGGVLAWYSLIHTHPDQIGALLAELARCVRPGGALAIGFFVGAELAPFDHAVTTAYHWPVDLLASRIQQAGFAVTEATIRDDSGERSQGTILAQRSA